MPGKAICKDTIKRNTVKDMQKLGVYKAEYGAIIDIYCELREQYERLTKEFKDGGYQDYKSLTADGGEKKSSLMGTLESLRKDILQYSDRLCLNPKSLMKDSPTQGKKQSLLGAALMSLEQK